MEAKEFAKVLNSLTTEQKIGQLFQTSAIYLHKDTKADNTGTIEALNIKEKELWSCGSVLNFANANEVNLITSKYQKLNNNLIDLAFMHDVIHGYRTIYPLPLALATSFNPELVKECSKMAALEARSGGVQVTFAPMVDLVRDARWGRVMESCGEDSYLNSVMAKAQIDGFHEGGLLTCAKHFVGYGAAEAGRDYNTTEISNYNLYNFYLPAFKTCIDAGVDMIMSSFNALNGYPLNANRELLVDILRNKWKFDGVLISDYNGVIEMLEHAVCQSEKECAEKAFNNQVDIEMVSVTYLKHLAELINEGKVEEAQLNRTVLRVLKLKDKMQSNKNLSLENENKVCGKKVHRELVRKAASECITLLKNDDETLPLKQKTSIALYGDYESRDVLGSWSCHGDKNEAVSLKEGLINTGFVVNNESNIAICVIGETAIMSGEAASRTDISIAKEHIQLVKNLKAKGKKVITVVHAGRPLVLSELVQYSDAILYAWFLGTESGNALGDVISGKVNPSSKLTMSFPRNVGQCPLYYNFFKTGRPKINDTKIVMRDYKSSYIDSLNSPLYPFGFGLSYTTFAFSNLKTSASTIKENGAITVSIDVKNTGKVAGKEVIQLYIQDVVGTRIRPVKELKQFKKIMLGAGEKQTIKFILKEEELRYFINKDNFASEKGEYTLMVGNSSEQYLSTTIMRE